MIRKQVVVEVSGGVAELCHASPGVEVRIIDWDNLEELTQAQRNAFYARELKRQKRAELLREDLDEKYRDALGTAIGGIKWMRQRGQLNGRYAAGTIRRLRMLMREHS